MAKLNKNCTASSRVMSAGSSLKASAFLRSRACLGVSLGNGSTSTKASNGSQASQL